MRWVVRFYGVWTICGGGTAAISHLINLTRYGLPGSFVRDTFAMAQYAVLLAYLALICCGYAMIRRRRAGFWVAIALTVAVATTPIVTQIVTARPGMAILLTTIPRRLLGTAAGLLVLVSLARRADRQKVLCPPHSGSGLPAFANDSISFLVSRIGWLFIAMGGVVFVDLAILPILRRMGVAISAMGWAAWQTAVQVGLYAAVTLCGVLMSMRYRQAIWVLVALLLPYSLSAPVMAWIWQQRQSPTPLTAAMLYQQIVSYAPGIMGTFANMCLLCILARKARRVGSCL